ncbi:hypothetical protein DPMN_095388 [Dreissena polymorpha]|uniref:Uncharacterized protein n=1 Tax=Dreissena polymorpha TaxID=45954 RepID=A0A9D4L991_DREPO|nr:hypothetical protein DPMN_095388 [Dreissena polymorpha]
MASIHIVEATEELGQGLGQKELREIRQKQRHDPLIDRWRKAVIDQKIPTKFNSKQDSIMRKQFKHFKIKRGILFRNIKEEERLIEQLVIPDSS